MAHAHARLVMHRDLKRSNILVDAQGQAHLLDFGIARLLQPVADDAGAGAGPALTQAVGRVLTPDCASPEQIRSETIGTASDVYSLGVVACELLSGVKPWQLQHPGGATLEAQVAALQAMLASTVARDPAACGALQGDLDAVLNMALKQDVAERCATVEAFAQDLERHQARLPVRARPDTPGYRLHRFIRRNALAVATAATVSVSLIAGLTVSTVQSRKALLQAERAEQVKEFVLSIFHDADADSEAGTSKSVADLLKAARQRVAKELAGCPGVAVELMTAIGLSILGQDLATEAAALTREAVAAQQVYGQQVVPQVLTLRTMLALAQVNEEPIAASLLELDKLVPATVNLLGANHPRASNTVHLVGNAKLNADGVPGAIAAFRHSVAVEDTQQGSRSSFNRAMARCFLAAALIAARRPGDALPLLDQTLTLLRASLGPTSRRRRGSRRRSLACRPTWPMCWCRWAAHRGSRARPPPPCKCSPTPQRFGAPSTLPIATPAWSNCSWRTRGG